MTVKSKIIINSDEADIILRSIEEKDIELIRKWKNENRKYFFHKELINPEQQVKWYQSYYLNNAGDYIFLIEYEGFTIGCIGFRLIDDTVDIYNVILGNREFGGKGIMSRALRLMCSYIRDSYKKDISLKVLSENKARSWYSKNGFEETGMEDDYIFMRLNVNKFGYLKYNLEVN